jgi:hypothetical protein
MSETYVLRFNLPGHPHDGRLVARKRRWAAYLEFTDEPSEARVVRRDWIYEWNCAFVTPEAVIERREAPKEPVKAVLV